MTESRKRAVRGYRSRLEERGLARFEVLGRSVDRDLIRSLAKRLAEGTPEATRLRATVASSLADEEPSVGRVLVALRRSPLVGADLEFSRMREEARAVDL